MTWQCIISRGKTEAYTYFMVYIVDDRIATLLMPIVYANGTYIAIHI